MFGTLVMHSILDVIYRKYNKACAYIWAPLFTPIVNKNEWKNVEVAQLKGPWNCPGWWATHRSLVLIWQSIVHPFIDFCAKPSSIDWVTHPSADLCVRLHRNPFIFWKDLFDGYVTLFLPLQHCCLDFNWLKPVTWPFSGCDLSEDNLLLWCLLPLVQMHGHMTLPNDNPRCGLTQDNPLLLVI